MTLGPTIRLPHCREMVGGRGEGAVAGVSTRASGQSRLATHPSRIEHELDKCYRSRGKNTSSFNVFKHFFNNFLITLISRVYTEEDISSLFYFND